MSVPRIRTVLAHRGLALEHGENTLGAFDAAVAAGASVVESDVHVTSDDVAVLLHDAELDRTTNASGQVSAYTWDQLRDVVVGAGDRIPRLDEVLRDRPSLLLNLDLKVSQAIDATARAIESSQAHDRVLLTSFDDRITWGVGRRLSRPVRTSPGRGGTAAMVAVQHSPRVLARVLARHSAVQVPRRYGWVPIVTSRLVTSLHDLGVPVHVWTVDDPAEMNELLELGVDGIVTNRCDQAIDVIRRRGEAVAPGLPTQR